jgi:hypothetical protein
MGPINSSAAARGLAACITISDRGETMKKMTKRLLATGCGVSIAAFLISSFGREVARAQGSPNVMLNVEQKIFEGNLFGTVKDGKFRVVAPASQRGKIYTRFFDIAPQVARAPKIVSIAPYEGKLILMAGQENGDALWGAQILGEVTPGDALLIRQNQHIIEQNQKIIELLLKKR